MLEVFIFNRWIKSLTPQVFDVVISRILARCSKDILFPLWKHIKGLFKLIRENKPKIPDLKECDTQINQNNNSVTDVRHHSRI